MTIIEYKHKSAWGLQSLTLNGRRYQEGCISQSRGETKPFDSNEMQDSVPVSQSWRRCDGGCCSLRGRESNT